MIVWQTTYRCGKPGNSSCSCHCILKGDKTAGKGTRTLQLDISGCTITLNGTGWYREDPWCRVDCYCYYLTWTIITTCRTDWYYCIGHSLWCIGRVDKLIGNNMIVWQTTYRCGKPGNSSCGCHCILKGDKTAGKGTRALQLDISGCTITMNG